MRDPGDGTAIALPISCGFLRPELRRHHESDSSRRADRVGPDYRSRSATSAVMNVCPVWHPMQKW